jgi:hypothetical protein
MAIEKGFTNIEFSRLRNFIPVGSDFKLPEKMDEISYVANATNFRRFILNKFGKDDLDPDQLIADDEDTRLTYQGYRRFLMSDLRHIFTLGADRNATAYKRETKYLAKQMLVRGYVSNKSQIAEKWIADGFVWDRLLQEQSSTTFHIICGSLFTSPLESTRSR